MNAARQFVTGLAKAIALTIAVAPSAWSQQVAAQPSPSHDGFPAGPKAQILSFSASASSIQPGQSVTLEWAVINADRIMLDRDIGIVAARGSRTVTPTVTTTYTLAALGYAGAGGDTRLITITVPGTNPAPDDSAEAKAALADKPVPRMPDGKPDLNGVYIAPFHSLHPSDKIRLEPGAEKYHV